MKIKTTATIDLIPRTEVSSNESYKKTRPELNSKNMSFEVELRFFEKKLGINKFVV